MEGGLSDIWRYQEWKYLPVEDILHMCRINRRMREICDDPETWVYLLERDYNIISVSDDPKQEYIIERRKNRLINLYVLNINRIDRQLQRQLPYTKAINVSTGALIGRNASSSYRYKGHYISPIIPDITQYVTFAFKKNLSPEDKRDYEDILYLFFNAH
jgi:hypothetical protein